MASEDQGMVDPIDDESLMATLDEWKLRKIREDDFLFAEAVHSLSTSNPIVEARKAELGSGFRWSVSVLCSAGIVALAQSLAVLSYRVYRLGNICICRNLGLEFAHRNRQLCPS